MVPLLPGIARDNPRSTTFFQPSSVDPSASHPPRPTVVHIPHAQKGITTFQLDIKCAGLTTALLGRALNQAKAGRLHILEEMKKALPEGRNEISQFVPTATIMTVDPDQIGKVKEAFASLLRTSGVGGWRQRTRGVLFCVSCVSVRWNRKGERGNHVAGGLGGASSLVLFFFRLLCEVRRCAREQSRPAVWYSRKAVDRGRMFRPVPMGVCVMMSLYLHQQLRGRLSNRCRWGDG